MGVNAQTAVPAFVAGEVLTAAEMTQVNTGIPVFATTVTRDAAFGGTGEKVLADGQFAYIEATKQTQFFDGSSWIAVNGLAPVIATSVAVGSGTASVAADGLITFTTVGTSLSVNGCFSASYLNYLVLVNQTNSVGNLLNVKLRAAGSDTSTAYYYVVADYYSNTTAIDRLQGNNQTAGVVTDSSAVERAFSMNVFNPFASKNTLMTTQIPQFTDTRLAPTWSYIGQFSTTSFDGITFLPSTGTTTGTMRIFGYNQ